ncbi:epithelial membrane protein-related [Anaeramoeba ignava]|uniref:Epithelial membrane protein-related n=1 Tax=Anaeramoeba ignava TaxID=1746090 RepID=A0A9Q0RFM0_ANAIG|nr:epithelial membrane protein-related [Anaeramoeba ignava]|eukprot:Anaeramoba_ignava/a225479_108.p1 GENE.a225479_108~~a225479_108.p1  ORF type:complete len:237 (+),score=18.43 a225479_108:92-712(+)
MGPRKKIFILFLIPILVGIISIPLPYWCYGKVTVTGQNDSDITTYLGLYSIKFKGEYVNLSNRTDVDETYKLQDMEDKDFVSSNFKSDWKDLNKYYRFALGAVVIAIGLSIIIPFSRRLFLILGWLVFGFFLISILVVVIKTPDIDQMVFESENAIFPIWEDGKIFSSQIISYSYSFFLSCLAALLSLGFYFFGIAIWKKYRKEYY